MLNRSIPRSTKIGITGLAALVVLGAFLLPMAHAEKTGAKETPTIDATTGLEKSTGDSFAAEPVAPLPPVPVALPPANEETVMLGALTGPEEGYYIAMPSDEVLGIRLTDAGVAFDKERVEIDSLRKQIDLLRRQLQRKLVALQKIEVQLVQKTSQKAQEIAEKGAKSAALKAKVAVRRRVGRDRETTADLGVLPSYKKSRENISDEVRRELQRILPGLLREMLPRLLSEAMSRTRGHETEHLDSFEDETMSAPRENTEGDYMVDDYLPGPVNAEKPHAIHR